MNIKEQIDNTKIPQHVAIIMDGNGRWAKKKGKLRIFGHQNGVTAIREALEGAAEIGVKYLTVYAFSSENWNRPKKEVNALMELLVHTLNKEVPTFQKNNIRLNAIGNLDELPPKCHKKLKEAIDKTKDNSLCTLTLALSYGSRKEIIEASKAIIRAVQEENIDFEDLNEDIFNQHLFTHNLPDPDLLIRTGGEQRISNFMLWQMAYTELIFLDIMWPEFKREDLFMSILEYQHRERRFGKISEQL